MNTFLLMLLLFYACLALSFSVKGCWERKKLRNKIEATFGVTPSDKAELRGAARFWEAYKTTLSGDSGLDDITWRDLDMDALFTNLNSCQSDVGAAWLYAQLRKCSLPQEEIHSRENLISHFAQHDDVRSKAQYQLAKLGSTTDKYLETALYGTDILQIRRLPLYILLAFVPFVPLFFIPLIGIITAAILFLLAASINATLTLYLRSRPHIGFPVAYGFAAILASAPRIAKALAKTAPEVSGEIDRLLRPFRRASLATACMHWGEGTASVGLIDPFSFYLLPVLCYAYLVRLMQRKKPEYRRLMELIGEIDLSISILATRKIYPYWCAPGFTGEKELSFRQLYHPMLSSAVPNSATFQRDILLTGSNASGKSTFIKAVAINCITAQALNTCFAEDFCLQKSAVLSSMAVQDSILEGDSYFVAELKSMKRITKKAEGQDFFYVFIDEILRGTNTTERIAASTSLLQYLSGKNCLVMAATHDLELTRLLAEEFDNYHFRETVQDNGVCFDYQLHKGPSCTKNAILLMDFMDFPKAIVEAANQRVAQSIGSTAEKQPLAEPAKEERSKRGQKPTSDTESIGTDKSKDAREERAQ